MPAGLTSCWSFPVCVPQEPDVGDQKRVMTPGEAVRAGADYIVVGRPITGASDPVEAARQINAETAGNLV